MEAEFGRREIVIFAILLLALGIISAIKPSYALIILGGSTLLILGVLSPHEAFLGTGIFLIFQAAIVRNMFILGAPEGIINLVNRIDEVIWVLFIGYLLLHNYQGNVWKFKKTKLDSSAIILATIGLISALINHNSLLWSSLAIFLTLKGFIMYWTAQNLSIDKYKVILFFKTVIYILVFAAIIGILQFLGVKIFELSSSERLGVGVAHSIFAHHGIFGSLMAVGIALSVGLKLGTGRNKWAALAIILTLGLIASSVRRSLVGLLLGLLFVSLNYRKLEIKKNYVYGIISISILLLVLFGGRISKIVETTEIEYGAPTQARYWLYYGAYKIIQNKPLLGEGPGRYGGYISVLTKSDIYKKYNIIIEDRYKMDSYWANILGEYGILGFSTLVILLLLLFRSLLKGYNRKGNPPFIRGLYIGYIILFVNYLVESLASPVYSKSLLAFMFFAGIGLLTGCNEPSSTKYHKGIRQC